jgi:antirestriction protein ArdC
VKVNLWKPALYPCSTTKKVADLEAAAEVTKAEYEAKLETATKVGEEVVAFKTAYISIVEADGVKISREADYSSKSLEELQTLHTEYLAEIAKLPSGQQSSSDVDDTKTVVSAYAGIPDHLFKSN